MARPEFIYLNDQAARITSLTPHEESGGMTLVVMARGSADLDQMKSLLNADDLTVRIGSEPGQRMRATHIDVRSTGEGPKGVHRVQTLLVPAETTAAPSAEEALPDDRLTTIEERLDRIIALLTDIRDRM